MAIGRREIGGKPKPVAIYDTSVSVPPTDYYSCYKYNGKKNYLKAGTVRGLCNNIFV